VFSHVRRAGHTMREYRLLTEPGDLQPEAALERTSAVPLERAESDEQLTLSLPAAFDPWSPFS